MSTSRRSLPLADRIGRAVLIAVTAFSVLLLVAPSLIVIAISFEPRAYISFPPSGFTLRWYQAVLENRQLMDSIVVSLRTALMVMVICLVIGVPAAFASVRAAFPARPVSTRFCCRPR